MEGGGNETGHSLRNLFRKITGRSSKRNTGRSSKKNTGKSTKGQGNIGNTNSPYAKNPNPAPTQGNPSGGNTEHAGSTSGKGDSINNPYDMGQNNNPGTGPAQPPGGAHPADGAGKPSGASGNDGANGNPPGPQEQSGNPNPAPAPDGSRPDGGTAQGPEGAPDKDGKGGSGPDPTKENNDSEPPPEQEDPADDVDDEDEDKKNEEEFDWAAYFRGPSSVSESELFGDEISTPADSEEDEDDEEEEEDFPWPVHHETEAQWLAKNGTSPEGLPKPYSPREDMERVVGEVNNLREESHALHDEIGKLIDKNADDLEKSMTKLRDEIKAEIKSEISELTSQFSQLEDDSTMSEIQSSIESKIETEIRNGFDEMEKKNKENFEALQDGFSELSIQVSSTPSRFPDDSGIDMGSSLGTPPDGESTPAPRKGKTGPPIPPLDFHRRRKNPETPSPLSQSSKPGDTSASGESSPESSPSKSGVKETPEKEASTAPAGPGTEDDPITGEISIKPELGIMETVSNKINSLNGTIQNQRAGGSMNPQQQPQTNPPPPPQPETSDPRLLERLTTLGDGMTEMNTQVETVRNDMTVLHRDMDRLRGDVNTLGDNMNDGINTLRGDINTNGRTPNTAINTINTSIDGLRQDMTQLRENVDTLGGNLDDRINTIRGDMNTNGGMLGTAINAMNTSIGGLRQDMTQLQEDVLMGMVVAPVRVPVPAPPGALAAERFFEGTWAWAKYGFYSFLALGIAISLIVILGSALGAFTVFLSEFCLWPVRR
ncbi:hypothetical protein PGQ11_014878 [Apiospora arundinis]|uniref:t-SNARE coiled-coil homology domain-containing protein n=1 Tax=Apiospora arundinis TaxID=335852 RepID=A0ABR2HKB8_9PEZI